MDNRVDKQGDAPAGEDQALFPASVQAPRWLPWLFLCLIALGYVRTLGFDFVNWDDPAHVLANATVLGAGGSRERWLTPTLGYPIPVTVASYAIEYMIVGPAPWLYHATNVLLHLAVCGLLYGLGRFIGLGRLGASLAFLCFGLHPAVAEPVSWISGRKDLLATAFGLAATWVFLATSAHPKRRIYGALATTVLFTLAAFSKPSVLALPLVWILQRKDQPRARWPLVLPAVVVAGFAAAMSWFGQDRIGALHALPPLLSWLRDLEYALGYHLGLALFVLRPLAKHIPLHMPPSFDPAVDLLPAGVAMLAWMLARRLAEKQRRVFHFGLLFAVVAYVPSSGIVPLRRFLADSYVYLPLAGLALAAGAAAESLVPRVRPVLRWAAGLGMGLALLFGSVSACAAWHDGVSLWKSVYARYPDSPQVCLNLGNAFFERGEPQTALAYYEDCTRRFGPDHFAKNRAIALFAVGRAAEAEPLLRRLIVKDPGDPVLEKYLRFLHPGKPADIGSGPSLGLHESRRPPR